MLRDQYLRHESDTEAIMRRQLEDKKAVMRTPEGRMLVKEMLIRRLEFFNEAARQVTLLIQTIADSLDLNVLGCRVTAP